MAKIGIDFGTSYSTVSWVNPQTGHAEAIRINGKEKIPTMLYYSKSSNTPLVGDEAYAIYQQCRMITDQNELDEYLMGIFSDLKRYMNKNESIYLPSGVKVKYSDLIAAFLKYLKEQAEKNCFEGEEVTDVCITYPVKHTEEKKEIMREAAQKAGFTKVKLLMEPVAAAMGYKDTFDYKNKSILVYDFGGGTFDLAFVRFDNNGDHLTLEPIGDSECGGENIDRILYNEWDKIVKSATGSTISGNDGIIDLPFIKTDCIHQKETLCKLFPKQTSYTLRCFIKGMPRRMDISSVQWNSMISPVIDKTITLTKQMLAKVKAEHMSIDKTILIGGSSNIPLVEEKLKQILSSPPIHVSNLDIAVACGAAIYINQGDIPVKKCFCRCCGKELNSKMKFCPFCGKDNIRFDYRFKDVK